MQKISRISTNSKSLYDNVPFIFVIRILHVYTIPTYKVYQLYISESAEANSGIQERVIVQILILTD